MRLFLCEKPSQARDIAEVVGARGRGEGCLRGDGVVVTWCIGHLLEMMPPEAYDPAYKRWDLGQLPILPTRWKLEVTSRGEKQFKSVKTALAQASEVVLATDADREGETIGREVLERCGWRGPVHRLWLSALDPVSIRKALANLLPGEKTEPLYRAGLGRARADWLVGMNLSRLYTLLGRQRGFDGVLSVGRVQTPTLKLVVDRDREIEGFRPVAYFVLEAIFCTRAGTFRARWQAPAEVCDAEGRCPQRAAAVQVARKVQGREGRVTRADTERKSVGPPLPFDLGTLQQEASRRFGMTAQRVLDTAQALYETHKATTYPRTDCPYLPESQLSEASNVLKALVASDPALGQWVAAADTRLRSRAWNDTKITAHHAMIPTAAVVDIHRLSQDEQRLYDLIRRRYLAQFFPDHQYDQTTIEVVVEDETFKASGRVSRVTGWHAVVDIQPAEESGDDDDALTQSLPPVARGDGATVTDTMINDRKTKPPPRYTDGTLIAAMKSVAKQVQDPKLKAILKETAGIGTEATRPGIIETLLKRGFLVRKGKKQLVSTETGRALIDALPAAVTDPATTARWEQTLDDIAQGKGALEAFLAAQSQWVTEMVRSGRVERSEGSSPASAVPPVAGGGTPAKGEAFRCPVCGQPMRRRQGKAGFFWGCSGYPTCRATLPDVEGKPGTRAADAPKVNAFTTPAGNGLKTRRVPPGVAKPGAGVVCPSCGHGQLVRRTLKTGKNAGKPFIGCTGYPTCDYFSWAESGGASRDAKRT